MFLEMLRKTTQASDALAGLDEISRSLFEMEFIKFFLAPDKACYRAYFTTFDIGGTSWDLVIGTVAGATVVLAFNCYDDPYVAFLNISMRAIHDLSLNGGVDH